MARPTGWTWIRTQIPTTKGLPDTFMIAGNIISGDLGCGAFYTFNGATPDGPMAIQDLDGNWCQLLIDSPVNVGYFLAKGDGITDDTSAIQAAINTGYSISFPERTFLMNSNIGFSANGQKLIGVGPQSKIISPYLGYHVISCHGTNIGIHDLQIISTATAGDQGGNALIGLDGGNIDGFEMSGCILSAPTVGLDGLFGKAHNDSGRLHTTLNNINIHDNCFNTIGRIGTEIINNNDLTSPRVSNVRIGNNYYNGMTSMGVSISGWAKNVIVHGNNFINCGYGIESAGQNDGVAITNNIFEGVFTSLIALDNSPGTDTFIIANNLTRGTQVTGTFSITGTNGVINGNNFIITGNLEIANSHSIKISNNTIRTNAVLGLQLDNSHDCIVCSNIIDCSLGTTTYSGIRCNGASSINNLIRNNNIYLGSGGTYFDQIGGASGNVFTGNAQGSIGGL